MPLHVYRCSDCNFVKKHFINMDAEHPKECPRCRSKDYVKGMSRVVIQKHYYNVDEFMEHEIDPSVTSTLTQIGKEALDQDAGTLENLLGEQVLKENLAETDAWVDDLDAQAALEWERNNK